MSEISKENTSTSESNSSTSVLSSDNTLIKVQVFDYITNPDKIMWKRFLPLNTKVAEILLLFRIEVKPENGSLLMYNAEKLGITYNINNTILDLYTKEEKRYREDENKVLELSFLGPKRLKPSYMCINIICDMYESNLLYPFWKTIGDFFHDPSSTSNDEDDVDPFNLQRIGSWDGFVMDKNEDPNKRLLLQDNSLKNLLILEYRGVVMCVNFFNYFKAIGAAKLNDPFREPVFYVSLDRLTVNVLFSVLIALSQEYQPLTHITFLPSTINNKGNKDGKIKGITFSNEYTNAYLKSHPEHKMNESSINIQYMNQPNSNEDEETEGSEEPGGENE